MATTAAPAAVAYPAAELDRRFYAFAVDRAIAWAVFAGVGYLAVTTFFDDDRVGAGIGVCIGAVVLVSLLFALPLGLVGLSPGKALVGLRVVRPDDGRPIGVPAALLRTTVLGVAAVPTLGLGLATLAWTAVADPGGWRRGGHDKLSHAVVVDVRPVPDVDAEEARPRQIVNLTAMRLKPAPAPRSAPPVPAPAPLARPTSPPPSAPPAAAPTVPPAPRPVVPPPPAPTAAPPVPSPRPAPATPLGAVWRVGFDTGEGFQVEGLALVGRRPEARPGEPVRHLVPLRSADMSLSKTHAQFQVVPDGALVIMDRGSTNGSFVVRGGVSKALTAGRPVTLLDGDTVRLGDRTMTVTKG